MNDIWVLGLCLFLGAMIGIGLPLCLTLVLLNSLQNIYEQMDKLFANLDAHFEKLTEHVDSRFALLLSRIEKLDKLYERAATEEAERDKQKIH